MSYIVPSPDATSQEMKNLTKAETPKGKATATKGKAKTKTATKAAPTAMQALTTVIYSGPTKSNETFYDENFRFFLRHGLPCSYKNLTNGKHEMQEPPVRFVFVLSNKTKEKYEDYIGALNQSSCGNDLHIVVRQNRCYDMESARIALRGNHAYDVLGPMDHVVFVNCGLLGPLLPKNTTTQQQLEKVPFWTTRYTDMINDEIKLSGLTFNCARKMRQEHAHIQSMLWATDKIGLQTILDSGAIYDCKNQLSKRAGRDQLIERYEMGLSRSVMQAGYAIASHLPKQPGTFVWENATQMVNNNITSFPNWCRDLWFKKRLAGHVGEEGLLFYKRSREYPTQLDRHVRDMDSRWGRAMTEMQ